MSRARKVIRFGVIGLGLMGRDFASAAARWCHLLDLDFVPQITAICDTNQQAFEWFEDNFETITLKTTNYHDLLSSTEVDAIYCAVPHNLHQQFYVDIIRAGKHLLGEKPFGIDLAANRAILNAIDQHADVVVACSSEFPYYPGAQRIIQALQADRFGQIIDVSAGLLHSSDLDPNKRINWKRTVAVNGEYGCMGDLGMHALHIPLRFGWLPDNVYANLSNIVTERYNGDGKLAPCDTWDNAALHCEVIGSSGRFPMDIRTYRIAPGEANTWYLRIHGTNFSAEFSTKYPKTLRTMSYKPGAEQAWQTVDLGYDSVFPTVTGGIFEFGFTDATLQMWASFCDQLVHGRDEKHFYCATPAETEGQHRVLTASLISQREKRAVNLAEVASN